MKNVNVLPEIAEYSDTGTSGAGSAEDSVRYAWICKAIHYQWYKILEFHYG